MATGAAIATAVIGGISATASIGMGVKEGKDQKEAKSQAEQLADAQAAEAKSLEEQQLKQFQADQKNLDNKVEFGSEDDGTGDGSFNEFLSDSQDTSSTSLGGLTKSGLGFAS